MEDQSLSILNFPIELYNLVFDILKDNVINIVTLAHVNIKLHSTVSVYARNAMIPRRPNCKYAALINRIDVLKWAFDLHFPVDNESCEIAATNGNIDILNHLLMLNDHHKTLWNINIANKAALHGHIDVVKWLLNNIDNKLIPKLLPYSKFRNDVTHFKNNFIARRKFTDFEYRLFEDLTLIDHAAQSGNLDLCKFLKNYGFVVTPYTYHGAVLGGHIRILNWLKTDCKNLCEMDRATLYYGMINGNIEILEWLKTNGRVRAKDLRYNYMPLIRNDFKVLQWTIDNGYPLTVYTIGHTSYPEVVKWLRERGCEWNTETCATAVRNGYFETVKMLIENGCPWDKAQCVNIAIGLNEIEILKWIQNRN